MATGDEGMISPADHIDPVPRRQFVELVLGSGVLATVVAFVYPVLRYLVPPKELDLGSDAVVAGRVGERAPGVRGVVPRLRPGEGSGRLACVLHPEAVHGDARRDEHRAALQLGHHRPRRGLGAQPGGEPPQLPPSRARRASATIAPNASTYPAT